MLKVRVADRQTSLRVAKREIIRAVRSAVGTWRQSGEMSITLVDGREMTELNKRFTGRDGQTDVLAFALDDAEAGHDDAIGEVTVNATRAIEEAEARGVEAAHEMMLYVVHGILHLQGYDDHTPSDRRAMYSREAEALAAAGVPYSRPCPKRLRQKRRAVPMADAASGGGKTTGAHRARGRRGARQ